jgi:AcrR family transcriptional regulator
LTQRFEGALNQTFVAMNADSRAQNRNSNARKTKKSVLRGNIARVYRQTILEAAERVFGKRGFAAAKMTEIAKEAGLAAGTLYNYFESKEEIFQALIEHQSIDLFERLKAVGEQRAEFREGLIALVRAAFEHIEEHHTTFRLFSELGAQTEWELKRVAGASAEERYFEFVAIFHRAIKEGVKQRALREDISTQDLVAFLTGSMNGIVHAWLGSGGKGKPSEKAETIVDFFIRGAGARR